MLNLANLPDQMVSALSTEELNWVTSESVTRYLEELSGEFARRLDAEEILDLDEDALEELREIEREGIPKSSARQMEDAVARFQTFLTDKQLSSDLVRVPPTILNNYLRLFYSTLRTHEGLFYAPPTLICIRAGLNRYFNLNRPGVNIIGDPVFTAANRMLVSMVQKYKRANQPKARDEFAVIEKNDLVKIMDYFDRTNGEVLQQEVMFHLIYYFGLRGRETLPLLSKTSFDFQEDSEGKEYVTLSHDIISKNAKASLKRSEFENAKKARMYATEGSANCPVAALRLYLQLLDELRIESLFPKPCMNVSKGLADKRWYCAARNLGKNAIDQLMSTLSSKLALSKRYTNHCIRVTHVTVLKERGFSNAAIASNTGHKNPQSVERYTRVRRDADFRGMSAALSVETSSSQVCIRRIGRDGEVAITETMSAETKLGEQRSNEAVPTIVVNFNGTFKKCTFKLAGDDKQ